MAWNCNIRFRLWLSRIYLKILACDCNTHKLNDRSPYLAKLARGFVSYFKKKSAREESKEISEGKKEPHHIGKYTLETINQEIFSLENTKPMFREKKWKTRLDEIKKAIKNRLSRNIEKDICQYQLTALERIENQR